MQGHIYGCSRSYSRTASPPNRENFLQAGVQVDEQICFQATLKFRILNKPNSFAKHTKHP